MIPIKNIIFDFGGVLLDLAPERCKAAFHTIGFHAIDDLLNLTHQKGILDEMERGMNTPEGFCETVRNAIGTTGAALPTDKQILDAWREMADGIPAYKLEMIHRLASQGYHVSALSNTNVVHWSHCRPMFVEAGFPPEELFEYVWLSCEMHIVKPDPAIFEQLLAESGYIPEETLFIDDAASNCRVAERFGIRTFTPAVRSDWRQQLSDLLSAT